MTEERLWPGRLLCIALALAGCAAAALTMRMNLDLGMSLGQTADGQLLQGAAAVLIDAMVILMGVVAGQQIRKRRQWPAIGAGVLALLFALYSFSGVLGFGAKERIAKSQAVERSALISADVVKAAEARKTDYLDWLKSSATEVKGRVNRTAFLDEASKIVMAPPEKPAITTAAADPQAELLARVASEITGGEAATAAVQFWLIFSLAALLVTTKLTTFVFASALWPAGETAVAVAAEAEAAPEPAAEPVKAVEAAADEESEPKPVMLTAEAAIDLQKEREKKQVADFFAADMILVRGGRVRAATLYDFYQDWARRNRLTPMSHVRFGKACASLGVARDHNGKHVTYQGIQRRAQLARAA